jgi:retron-type reverse transcriptase
MFFDESRNFKISTPKTIPVIKDIKEKTYRPLSIFKLNDLIITGQVARYLSNCFDPLFSDSSYAFRTGIQKGKVFNHHKAIEDIIEFKSKVGKPLFVSECDIKKFYDCVNHTKISEKFQSIIKEAKDILNIEIDNRAVYFFQLLLSCFFI